jgi:valyl-tRNA synthetase
LLEAEKDYIVPLGKCDRCKTVVEPRLSTQWFVKVGPLAERAIEAVEKGEIRFTPDNYAKTYFEWMRNIHDWCISRQLWWGHRIPAWRCDDCKTLVVSRDTPTRCSNCSSANLEQDSDVLDTWFSSGLLPMSALGWPDKAPDLDVFYPTSLLITGFDILFFWVARMIMLGCHFLKDHPKGSVPFEEVYIHALVRDADRKKMSKTKGNVLDPIAIIEQYGTDATRFTLAAMAAPGTDIAFNPDRTDGYRAFANKIWNAARFVFMNVDKAHDAKIWSLDDFRLSAGKDAKLPAGVTGFQAKTLEDRWILSRFNSVANEIHYALEEYRFHEAANRVYDFFWGEFCDWYIELIKPRLSVTDSDAPTVRAACQNVVSLFEAALRLLHPFMPFITEEIWHAVYDGKPPLKSIALAPFPEPDSRQNDVTAEVEMAVLQDLIVNVRNLRADLKVDAKAKLPVQVYASGEVRGMVEQNRGAVHRLANAERVTFVESSLAKLAGSRSTARFDVRVVYEKKIDVEAECQRSAKELAQMEKELGNAEKQLNNLEFLSKAPAKVVEGLRRRHQELIVLREKTRTARAEMGCDQLARKGEPG